MQEVTLQVDYQIILFVASSHVFQLKMLSGPAFYHQDGGIFGLQSTVFTLMGVMKNRGVGS